MEYEFFQACYAHPDTGWAVVNTSVNMPKGLADDFSLIQRANAGLAAGKPVPMGSSENPTCMLEIYCKNNAVGLVRTQYSLSDGQGRPISFSHGLIFPRAYELLKDPNNILRISSENFADKCISEEKKAEIRSTPGAFNQELIRISAAEKITSELLLREQFTFEKSLSICGLSEAEYRRYILAIYAHLLSSNTEKNLYIKTDGSEAYAWNLLYLTYIALPYSMRTLLSASTYLRSEQHNSKLIFCSRLPEGVPQIDPIAGINNVMNDMTEKRTKDRNPFITIALDYVISEKQDRFYKAIEACLCLMGNERLNTLQHINLACSICLKEYNNSEKLPWITYSWLALPVNNSEKWEKTVCFLLRRADEQGIKLGEEVDKLLSSRLETAVTEDFREQAESYLILFNGRK